MPNERIRNGSNILFVLAGALIVILWVVYRSGWFQPSPEHRVLTLYCYSSLDEVMTNGVFPAFREIWKERTGEPMEFVATFAGSGEITRRILQRYPAEVAILSSELDAAAMIGSARTWKQLPHGGVLARSPLVVVVREGNPHGIRALRDLGGPDLALVQGVPASSGATNLALVAAYGEVLRESDDLELAASTLGAFWRNVKVPVASAREARSRFEVGGVDAFVTYEHDAVGNPARERIAGEIVYPRGTLVVEPIVVKIDSNTPEKQRPVVDAFTEFLWSSEGQRILAEYGFRRIDEHRGPARPDLPQLDGTFTLDDLGGASKVRREILDGVWKQQVRAGVGAPSPDPVTDSE